MSLTITPSTTQLAPGQPFEVRLAVSDQMSLSTPLTAKAELANGTTMTETTTVTITGRYGPVSAAGYTAVQDPDDPTLFHLTPVPVS